MIIVVIVFFVVKGSIMNSKLLKVCAAVMLIAGTGDVMGNGGSIEGAGGAKEDGRSVQIGMEAKVKAVLSIKSSDGNESSLQLYNDDGSKTEESKRTHKVKVDLIGDDYELRLSGVTLKKSEDSSDHRVWVLPRNKEGENDTKKGELKVAISVTGPDDEERYIDDYSMNFSEGDTSGEWSFLVDPPELKGKRIFGGNYSATLKIEVVPKG